MVKKFSIILIFLGFVCFGLSQNPFLNKNFYVNPGFQSEIDKSIDSCVSSGCSSKVISGLKSMRQTASAVWIDSISKIHGQNTSFVDGILADAAKQGPNTLAVFIIYDLPNRDCHASASNGEICCKKLSDGKCDYTYTGDCSEGLQTYKSLYIDEIVTLFQQYESKVSIIAVIEPDSLPNLATNTGDQHCGNSATRQAYTEGIKYAVEQLATKAPKVVQYLDAAHGGWLGWTNNAQSYANTVRDLGLLNYIRGFATNVANYQPLGSACPQWDWCLNAHSTDPCCSDPCKLTSQYNPSNNELNYVQQLNHLFASESFQPHFIIDTGRNGREDVRSSCSNWCNIRNAGIGALPTTNTPLAVVDAYFWLKTPGESDGCTQTLPSGSACPRFDYMCGSQDSLGSISDEPRAPEAGQWFDYQIKQLVENWETPKIVKAKLEKY